MRDYTGIPYQLEKDPIRRQSLVIIDYFLKDLNRGIARISKGQIPDGSGNTIPVGTGGTLDDYLYLPGRVGGQRIRSADGSSVTVQVDGPVLSTTNGSFGRPALTLVTGNDSLVGLAPMRFDNNAELAFVSTDSTGFGVGVNFPSADGTSALRISSTANRTFLQCGLKISTGNVQNANMTVGATGQRVASSLAYEFQRITLASTAVPLADGTATNIAKTTRVGINIRADDYASTVTLTDKAKSLHVGDHQIDAVPTWPAATDPAPLIIENSGDVLDRHLFELRSASQGSSPSKTLGGGSSGVGGVGLALCMNTSSSSTANINGAVKFYWGNAFMSKITAGNTNSALDIRTSGDVLNFRFQSFNTFSGSVASSVLEPTSTNGRLMIVDSQGNALSRIGLAATSIIQGSNAASRIPAAASTTGGVADLYNWVSSANPAVLLSGIDSAGAYFLSSGAAAGKLFQSNASGVGSWATTLTGAYVLTGGPKVQDLPLIIDGVSGTYVSFLATNATDVLQILDDGAGNTYTFQVLAGFSGAAVLSFPAAGGTLLTTNASQTVTNKRISSGSVGVTGQTAGIATTSITISPNSAGIYVLEVYAMCTVASGSGAPTLDVTIGWTDTVGATTKVLIADASSPSPFALSLAATGRAFGRVIASRASGNLTYATTINAASGSPQYSLFIRVLG